MSEQDLLIVENLKKHFKERRSLFGGEDKTCFAVDDVSFRLKKGETLGLVGESGCGKSTLGRSIVQIYKPTSGKVIFDGCDLSELGKEELRKKRKDFQIIFQDPFSSLNPRMTVGSTLIEPLLVHNLYGRKDAIKHVYELLELVGLPSEAYNRYPHEFSGGQRQRIGIARALALKPKLIVADEPVSALDVSIQSQILNLLVDLREKFQLSYVFIAHDLAVIEHISDIVAVMYLGRIVEKADAEDLYASPRHPYTQALIDSIPEPDVQKRKTRAPLGGDVPSPLNPPSGCYFHPRCPIATDKCKIESPVLRNVGSPEKEHLVACHYAK